MTLWWKWRSQLPSNRIGFVCLALCLSLLLSGVALAKDTKKKNNDDWDLTLPKLPKPSKKQLIGWEDPGEVPKKYPYLEHHGYLRIRFDWFWRAHLNTNTTSGPVDRHFTSGFLPPLTENVANNDPSRVFKGLGSKAAKSIASSNLRFRYQPTIHITKDIRIKSTFDILDNLVLGSTPDFAPNRPDAPLSVFSNSQAPPSSGRNSVWDSVRVKEVYGEWRTFFATFRAGRMARHWGTGMLLNAGTCDDCDYGSYYDRIDIAASFFGSLTVRIGWDFVSEGPTSANSGTYFGQPRDLDQLDDVNQWTLEILYQPVTTVAKKKFDDRLHNKNKPVFEAGLYAAYRRQSLDQSKDTYKSGLNYDDYVFVPRDAWMVTIDAWARLRWQPKFGHKVRLEFEGAYIFGRLGSAVLSEKETSPSRKIERWGAVVEAEYNWKGLTVGLNIGAASGDDQVAFGVNYGNQANDPKNLTLTNFTFNRDYIVDMMLFREVIGSVTNAIFFRPYVAYDLFDGDEDALGASLSLVYGRALRKSGTPGLSSNLGFEFDLKIFYAEKNRFRVELAWGMLFPMDGLDNTSSFNPDVIQRKSAKWTTTVQGRFVLMF